MIVISSCSRGADAGPICVATGVGLVAGDTPAATEIHHQNFAAVSDTRLQRRSCRCSRLVACHVGAVQRRVSKPLVGLRPTIWRYPQVEQARPWLKRSKTMENLLTKVSKQNQNDRLIRNLSHEKEIRFTICFLKPACVGGSRCLPRRRPSRTACHRESLQGRSTGVGRTLEWAERGESAFIRASNRAHVRTRHSRRDSHREPRRLASTVCNSSGPRTARVATAREHALAGR
jgi:hypothetical protein